MRRAWLAISVCGLSVTLSAATLVCRRMIFDLGPKKLDHKPTQAALDSWKEYNKTHIPPKPKEILREIDLICPEVQLEQPEIGFLIAPAVSPEWDDQGLEVRVQITPAAAIEEVKNEAVHPAVYLPTILKVPTVPTEVPEPESLYLLLTGALAVSASRILSRARNV